MECWCEMGNLLQVETETSEVGLGCLLFKYVWPLSAPQALKS